MITVFAILILAFTIFIVVVILATLLKSLFVLKDLDHDNDVNMRF